MKRKKSILSDFEILHFAPSLVDGLLLEQDFSHIKNLNKKIHDLTVKGHLEPIRRGLYLNLKSNQLAEVCKEILANSIYFPSYVSLEWALQYYNLIPERVTVLTSVTTNPSCEFKTSVGVFSYEHLSKNRYPVGYGLSLVDKNSGFLIATPIKSVMDYINLRRKGLKISGEKEFSDFLEMDLRLDEDHLLSLTQQTDFEDLIPHYHRNSTEYRMLKYLSRRKG